MSHWDKTEVTNQKKRLCLFITMKKKVNRKTNKIRQFFDDPKKKKNVAERNAPKKKNNRFEKRRKKK
jgi:hypothetical protein